ENIGNDLNRCRHIAEHFGHLVSVVIVEQWIKRILSASVTDLLRIGKLDRGGYGVHLIINGNDGNRKIRTEPGSIFSNKLPGQTDVEVTSNREPFLNIRIQLGTDIHPFVIVPGFILKALL